MISKPLKRPRQVPPTTRPALRSGIPHDIKEVQAYRRSFPPRRIMAGRGRCGLIRVQPQSCRLLQALVTIPAK